MRPNGRRRRRMRARRRRWMEKNMACSGGTCSSRRKGSGSARTSLEISRRRRTTEISCNGNAARARETPVMSDDGVRSAVVGRTGLEIGCRCRGARARVASVGTAEMVTTEQKMTEEELTDVMVKPNGVRRDVAVPREARNKRPAHATSQQKPNKPPNRMTTNYYYHTYD